MVSKKWVWCWLFMKIHQKGVLVHVTTREMMWSYASWRNVTVFQLEQHVKFNWGIFVIQGWLLFYLTHGDRLELCVSTWRHAKWRGFTWRHVKWRVIMWRRRRHNRFSTGTICSSTAVMFSYGDVYHAWWHVTWRDAKWRFITWRQVKWHVITWGRRHGHFPDGTTHSSTKVMFWLEDVCHAWRDVKRRKWRVITWRHIKWRAITWQRQDHFSAETT